MTLPTSRMSARQVSGRLLGAGSSSRVRGSARPMKWYNEDPGLSWSGLHEWPAVGEIMNQLQRLNTAPGGCIPTWARANVEVIRAREKAKETRSILGNLFRAVILSN